MGGFPDVRVGCVLWGMGRPGARPPLDPVQRAVLCAGYCTGFTGRSLGGPLLVRHSAARGSDA